MLLRPEEYSFYCYFEHLACRRNSLIMVGHDVPLWGGGWRRVKAVTVSGSNAVGVTLDDEVAMVSGESYACVFRKNDGTGLSVSVETNPGTWAALTFQSAIPSATGPEAGDLCMFGEAGRETAELVVKRIERSTDFSAKLICVDHAPAIYNADTEAIPVFDTQITGPIDITRIAPVTPSISRVESGTRALEVSGGIIRARIFVDIAEGVNSIRVGSYRVRYRTGQGPWKFIEWLVGAGITGIISDVIEGVSYQLQAQTVSIYGIRSAWSAMVSNTVTGQSEIPADVENFRCSIVGTEARLAWDANTDLDLAYYRIRWSPEMSGATWAESIDIVPNTGLVTAIGVSAMVGTYLIKAVDRGRRESANASTAATDILRIAGLNVVETFSQAHPAWSGTGTNAEADSGMGGIVISDLESEAIGYYEFAGHVDLGSVFTCRLTASMRVGGQDISADLYSMTDLYASPNLYGDINGKYNVELEAATTEDDPDGTPTWGAWKQFLVGDHTGRAFKFRAKLIGTIPTVTPILKSVTITVDMPDRTYGNTVSVGSGGASITFFPSFYETPDIGISWNNGEEGDSYTITSKSASGFTIRFFNGGVGVARTLSFVAKGCGELES
jgi:hypothetical protein